MNFLNTKMLKFEESYSPLNERFLNILLKASSEKIQKPDLKYSFASG